MGNDYLLKNCCENKDQISKNDFKKENSLVKSIQKTPLSQIALENIQIKKLWKIPIKTKNVIRKITGSPYDFYDEISLIGIGAYGKVYKVQHKKTLQIRAMKVISKTQLKENFNEESIKNEIEVLKNINHPNIIKLYEVFHDDVNYYLINDYCSEGELCKYLIDFKKFPEVIVRKLMYDIFSAVSYLHSNGIIHGDIKLENLTIDCNAVSEKNEISRKNSSVSETSFQEALNIEYYNNISSNNSTDNNSENNNNNNNIVNNNTDKNLDLCLLQNLQKYDLKLIDFGCSKIFSVKKNNFNDDNIGTITYTAPEVLKNNYTEKCDIWSCGVIMYLLLTGEFPFYGITEEQIKNKILRGKFCFYNRLFKNISYEAKDLIRQCFLYDPNKRISTKEALNHPFFKNEIMDNLYINLDPEIENKTKEAILSLINFSNKSKFFQTIITFLTHNFIPKEEETRLKNVFLSIDSDFDGKISRNDLRNIFYKFKLDISEEELQKIMERVDFDNDGYIDYTEFLQVTINLNNLFTEENLEIAFSSFDTHNDGTVSVLELEEILGLNDKTNRNVIFELMKEINKTELDEFNFEEFKSIVMKFLNKINDENKNNYINEKDYKEIV